ncbi:MAG TPA: hypothetical protein VEC14_08920 [Reyranellaceae bacterium]|nr:hypothetical protein [Reyranellaceae bacterium]
MGRYLKLAVVLVAAAAAATGAIAMLPASEGPPVLTVGEKLLAIGAERAALQARADGTARLTLLEPIRIASLLTDALIARHDGDGAFATLPASRRAAFVELDALNATLREAMSRPGEGTRAGAAKAAERAAAALARLAEGSDAPIVLALTPRFVPPRRAHGELVLAPASASSGATNGAELSIAPPTAATGEPPQPPLAPIVPRYAPEFAAASAEDPPLRIEIVGLRLANGGRPVLAVGGWRGTAELGPERLFFTVPRAAFATDALRSSLANAVLSVRRGGRTFAFQLPLVVLPDRAGSFAFDQKVRTTELETNTLVSPEILARAGTGETKTTRRCFNPPDGWRFDKATRRIVIVERLGWLDDIGDGTLNAGTVEFAADEGTDEICFVVGAKPSTKAARTATIGRFEVTLLRDKQVERAIRTGVRALDWREPARSALDPAAVEQRLYVRLFDEVDFEFTGQSLEKGGDKALPFLRIVEDRQRGVLTLAVDPALEPK